MSIAMSQKNFDEIFSPTDAGRNEMRRAAYAVAGLSAALYGIWKRDRLGWPLLIGGGYFLYRAVVQKIPHENSIELAQTVNRSAEEIFSFWRNLSNWPLFMDGMDRIRSAGSASATWT